MPVRAARIPLSPFLSFATACLVAAGSAWIAATADHSTIQADIDQLWFAARALLQGRDPYALIGPGREFEYDWPLYYPLPAALFLVPLAPLPAIVARIVMAAASGGLLAYLIARTDPRALILFASYAYYANAWYAQWTPLLMCALYVPAIGLFFAAKPSVGAAMLGGMRESRAMRVACLAAFVPAAVSFVVQPGWIARWLIAVESSDHFRSFVSLPGGFLLLLAVMRWRRWEARLFLAMAVLPQTLHPLATLPLLLLPATLIERALLALLTFLPSLMIAREPWGSRFAEAPGFAEATQVFGSTVLVSIWLPALVMLLRRPNEGPLPARLERRLERWPAWLRGRSAPPPAPGMSGGQVGDQ
jgi:hypothetical protein